MSRRPSRSHWLGADPVDAFATAAELDLGRLAHPRIPLRHRHHFARAAPGDFAGVIHLVELVAHGVDLAVATRQLHLVDEQLCEEVLALVTGMGGVDLYRVPTVFGPEVPVHPEAPAHARLAAYLGRHLTEANATATAATR